MRGQTDLEFLQETIYEADRIKQETECSIRIAKRVHDREWKDGLKVQLKRIEECRAELEDIRKKMLGA